MRPRTMPKEFLIKDRTLLLAPAFGNCSMRCSTSRIHAVVTPTHEPAAEADRLSLSRVFAGQGGPQGRVREESARFMALIRGNTALAVRPLPQERGFKPFSPWEKGGDEG